MDQGSSSRSSCYDKADYVRDLVRDRLIRLPRPAAKKGQVYFDADTVRGTGFSTRISTGDGPAGRFGFRQMKGSSGRGICDGRVRPCRRPFPARGMREMQCHETPRLGPKVDRLDSLSNSRFFGTATPWNSARRAGRSVKSGYLVGSVCRFVQILYRSRGL